MWYPGKARREAKRRAEQEQAKKNARAHAPALLDEAWIGRKYLTTPGFGGRDKQQIERLVVNPLTSGGSEPTSGLTRVIRQDKNRVSRQPLLVVRHGYGQVTISLNRARLSEWKFVATHPKVAKRRLIERFAYELTLREAMKDAALFL